MAGARHQSGGLARGIGSGQLQIVGLNRALLEAQILEDDPSLLERTALDQFLVIAPGGLIENKTRAMGGTKAWDAAGI